LLAHWAFFEQHEALSEAAGSLAGVDVPVTPAATKPAATATAPNNLNNMKNSLSG
jgi:hypothetical protein